MCVLNWGRVQLNRINFNFTTEKVVEVSDLKTDKVHLIDTVEVN